MMDSEQQLQNYNYYSLTKILWYRGKVWRVESLVNLVNHLQFAKLKPSKVVVTINNPLADLFIRQTFFHQTLEKSKFAKPSPCQIFPLYGIPNLRLLWFSAAVGCCATDDDGLCWSSLDGTVFELFGASVWLFSMRTFSYNGGLLMLLGGTGGVESDLSGTTFS